MNCTNYTFTTTGLEVMDQITKQHGLRIAIDLVTDTNPDFNNDGKVSGLELTVLRQSINRRGKVDQTRLQSNLKKLNNGCGIFTVHTTPTEDTKRATTYVTFRDYKYIEINESQNGKDSKRIGVHPDRIEIEEYSSKTTEMIPRNAETEAQYLSDIDLEF